MSENQKMHNLQNHEKLKLCKKIGYSIGHFYNDLISSYVFSYMLVYVRLSVGLESSYGGYLFVAAQIADIIGSATIGIIQDKYQKLGNRIIWYIAGLIIITLGLAITFNVTFGSLEDSQLLKMVYFIPPNVAFGFGYAFIQVTHLAILPDMTMDETERVQLTSWRNAATLIGFLSVYCGVWILLTVQSSDSDLTKLTSQDVKTFRTLSQIIVAIGLTVSLAFCVLMRKNLFSSSRSTRQSRVEKAKVHGQTEAKTLRRGRNSTSSGSTISCITIDDNVDNVNKDLAVDRRRRQSIILSNSTISYTAIDVNVDDVIKDDFSVNRRRRRSVIFEPESRKWLRKILKEAMFYEVAIIYSCTTFAMTVTQMYIPLYVTETLEMGKVAIGILPLILYVSGFVMCFLMKRLCKRFGIKKIFITGEIFTFSSCVWMFFITSDSHQQIYAAVIIFGAGQATLNVTALSMITKLIGRHVNYGSTIFGMIAFIEKLVKGIFFVVVTLLNTCGGSNTYAPCSDFYRIIIVSSPGITAIIASIVMISRHIKDKKAEEKEEKRQLVKQQTTMGYKILDTAWK